MNKLVYEELIAFHPGYYVKDLLEEEGMTQEELAKRLQTSGKNISDLLHGKINLTDEMALRLSIVFGTSVSMWLNLNQNYSEKKLEIERRMQEDAECALAEGLDYEFWRKLNLVPRAETQVERVRELQKFLKVSSLEVLKRRDFMVQYRKTPEVTDSNVIAANAWVQTGLNMAIQMETEAFCYATFKWTLSELRKMTKESFLSVSNKIQEMLAECGVALVFLPNLKSCGVKGAVKWLHKEKVMLAINKDYQYEDEFWFSLFHELGHVLQQRLKVLIVSEKPELMESDDLLTKLEEDADSFANNLLVPDEKYDVFLSNKVFSEDSIRKFAIEIDTTPEIVMRRMQRERLSNYALLLKKIKK